LGTGKTQDSALTASDETALAMLTASLRARASASNHRLTLALAGNSSWTLSAAKAALSTQTGKQVVWLTQRRASGLRLPLSRGDKLLGAELDILVYDTHSGLDPDSLGAALGALRGGGLLLLLTPPLESWPRLPDPQAARVAVHPFSAEQVTGRFLRRFVRALASAEGVILLSELDPVPQLSPSQPLSFSPIPLPMPSGDCCTPDQARAVEAILRTARGHPRRPLVLTSNRGRGKSSALGIAAARLLANEPKAILVTAPRRSAVEPIFHQVARLLPQAQVHDNRIRQLDGWLQFVPPDELCRVPQVASLLLVDEAAGIPAPQLEHLLREHSRIVFATTVQGYEGTGRGFEVRFRHTLDRLTPQWREIRMETPIRWAEKDPLEQLAARALLLDAAPAEDRRVAGAHPETCRFLHLDRDALGKDEATLSQLFGLLVLAHYQTRPMDLRHLLDGPNIRIYALLHERQVAATALVAIEGGFGPDLTRDVFAGRRRPRGHLLPQTLCAHAGIQEAPMLGYARVIRIAVHPAAQDRGLGRFLLEGIIGDARTGELDLAGSSFGATEGLLDFWERCGFRPVHIGTSRSAASGAHAAVVLHPLSSAGDSLRKLASERLRERLPLLLAEPLRDLAPEIAACLLRSAPPSARPLRPWECRELESFAFALRPYEAALPTLTRLVSGYIGEALRAGAIDDRERDLLICKVLQHRDWGETARLLGLTGRAQVIALLRAAVGTLIEH
jgi:tRNA(Met) cytidine acetyltransferase